MEDNPLIKLQFSSLIRYQHTWVRKSQGCMKAFGQKSIQNLAAAAATDHSYTVISQEVHLLNNILHSFRYLLKQLNYIENTWHEEYKR